MNTPASPCIQDCRIDPATGWCVSCYRSIEEITEWGSLSDQERQSVLDALAERRQPKT